MKKQTILLSVALALITRASLAQGFPQGRPDGPPMGGRTGGFGRMRPGLANPDMLLRRDDVQADLALSDEQKSKLDTLMQSMRPQGGRNGQSGPGGPGGVDFGGPPPDGGMGGPPMDGPGGGGPGRGGPGGPGGGDDFRQQMEANRARVAAEIVKILTPEQRTRLKQIAIGLAGNAAVSDATVQKELALTDVQKTRIKSLVQKQGEANLSVMEKARSGEIERDAVVASMQRNAQVLDTELGKVLTDAQKAKLKQLAGKPFVANSDRLQGD